MISDHQWVRCLSKSWIAGRNAARSRNRPRRLRYWLHELGKWERKSNREADKLGSTKAKVSRNGIQQIKNWFHLSCANRNAVQ